MKPIIIGHRSAAAHALENTAGSVQAALRFGVDMVEFDIHESLKANSSSFTTPMLADSLRVGTSCGEAILEC